MPNKLTLTTFVDFVSKSGPPKITVVRHFKRGSAYHPAFDFYKGARDAIVGFHRHARPKKALAAMVTELKDPKKAGAYAAIARGHRKFVGRRKMRWFDPPVGTWNGGGIAVHVNPSWGSRSAASARREALLRRSAAGKRGDHPAADGGLRMPIRRPCSRCRRRRGVTPRAHDADRRPDALLAAEADAFARIRERLGG
jgi:hypothetical protein